MNPSKSHIFFHLKGFKIKYFVLNLMDCIKSRNRQIKLLPCLFIVINIVFICTSCKDGFKEISDQPIEKPSTIYLDHFNRESIGLDGKLNWQIQANKAFVYMKGSQQNRLIVYEFSFTEFDEAGKIQNEISGTRGEIDYEEGVLHLDGNVVSKNQFGRVVKSKKMKYNMEEKIFTSDSRVEIVDVNTHLVCATGARIEVENNKQICKGPTVVKKNDVNKSDDSNETLDLDIFQ